MANGRRRAVNYKPRYTSMEAYDLLPDAIRDALKEGPQPWGTNSILRRFKAYSKKMGEEWAVKKILRSIRAWHEIEIEEGKCWRNRRVGQKWDDTPLSPHMQANATMQQAYGPYKKG